MFIKVNLIWYQAIIIYLDSYAILFCMTKLNKLPLPILSKNKIDMLIICTVDNIYSDISKLMLYNNISIYKTDTDVGNDVWTSGLYL